MAIMKEAKTLTFGDTQYVVVDADAREKIAELEQSANETLPALKQQIETHSSDNNAHSDIRDAIPTKVSQLANDSQFIAQESDPTVPSWAKQETKPEYTAMEVGADTAGTAVSLVNAHAKDTAAHADIRQAIPTKLSELSNDTGYLTGFTEIDPTVPSWAKQPNKPSYTASEVGAEPAGTSSTVVSQHNTSNVAHTDIRNEVKALNDEFASHEHNNVYDSKGSAESALTEAKSYTDSKTANLASTSSVNTSISNHNTNAEAHNDIRLELKAINDRLNAFFDSDDKTLDELSEIVAYITNNKTLIDSITTSKVNVEDIINNLTTNVANKPLSAAQGVALKGLIDSVSTSLSNYQPKGNYALKSELPTKVSQLSNDSGYLTEHQDISGKLDSSALPAAINTALAQAKVSGEFDGKDGKDGQDGYTPQKNVDYFDGKDGSNGKDGTSVTVKSVSESTADGGSNVVTFSDGKALTVKNGSKGSDGAKIHTTPHVSVNPDETFVCPIISLEDTNIGDLILSTNPSHDGELYKIVDINEADSEYILEFIADLRGKNGISCTHSWNGTTLSITSASGTSSVNLKGDKGATGQRGAGLLPVTTAPSSYTTAVGDITPKYRMALSAIKTQSGATEVLLGDTVRYSYYHYPIAYLDASYAYFTTRVSIRGAAGAAGTTPVKGTDYYTVEDKQEIVDAVIAALPVYTGEVI